MSIGNPDESPDCIIRTPAIEDGLGKIDGRYILVRAYIARCVGDYVVSVVEVAAEGPDPVAHRIFVVRQNPMIEHIGTTGAVDGKDDFGIAAHLVDRSLTQGIHPGDSRCFRLDRNRYHLGEVIVVVNDRLIEIA